MTQEEFNVVFELQMRKCADILAHKKKEYTGDNIDRLSAFKIAAALQNCDPKAALAGMMSKHVVSLYDMCYSTLLHFDMEQWDEKELKEMQTQIAQHRSDLRILNDQIRYTGQYYANKEIYSQFSNAKYKGKYRKEHAKEIQKYEEARDWLRSFYQDGKMTSLKTLTLQKEKLQQQIASEEEAISSLKEKLKDLDTADQNVDAILQMQIPEPVRSKTKDLER